MKDRYKTVKNMASAEIVEKRSRFIASVKPVESEHEAVEFINELRKKYWDASHNVYAYIVEENGVMRYSDDGEPSGTAGMPVLDMLKKEGLTNTVVVVTRYFGGILLGTGGLVRAYSKAVQEGLANSCIIERKHGILLAVETDYNGIGRIQYLAGERRIPIQEAEYTEKVCLKLLVPVNSMDEIQKAITEGTSGKAKMRKVKELYFAEKDGEYLLYEI